MILAADIGSTWLKAALFAPDGRRFPTAGKMLEYRVRTAERAEIDPLSLRLTFLDLIDQALASAGCSRGDLRRVAITSQAQTFCLCDAAGAPLTPMLGWTDARAAAEAEELQRLLGPRFHRTTGIPVVSPLSKLAKALWWSRQGQLPADARIVQISSWLAMSLGAPHAIDANLAAMSGLFSIPDHTWWGDALEAAGLRSAQLGIVVDPGVPLPATAHARPSGFPADLDVVFAANDHTAGAVASGCRSGNPVLTLGTAGVIYRYAGGQPGPFSAEAIWGPFPGGGYYELLFLPHACSALDWADGFLFGKVDSDRFVQHALAAGLPRSAPFFDPSRWGSEDAWSERGTPGEMAYAALEGIAFALRSLGGAAFDDDKGTITVLGGGSRLDRWVRLCADVLQRPIVRGTRDGIDGAAMIAGVPRAFDGEENLFHPDPARSRHLDERFLQWQTAFSSMPHSPAIP
jgi:sugar (pentulose or hexulose) kinase